MISFRNLRSIFADIRGVIALRRRSKFMYKPRVWQLNELDPLNPTENYRYLSDRQWYHTRACYVSIDLDSQHSPNSEQVGGVIQEIKEKLFGGEFYMGLRKRKVSKRCQLETLASIASSIQEILASVGHPGTVYIGVAFGVLRWERRGTEEEEEEFNEDDEGAGEGEEEGSIIEEAIGENDVYWDGVGGSSESIEGLEAVSWERCEGSLEWVTSCVVCLEEFGDCSEVEELRRLPCLHVFHKDCIARWMEESHLCPLCRFPITRSTS